MTNEPPRPARVGRFELRRPLEHTVWTERYAGYELSLGANRHEVVVELLSSRWMKDPEVRALYLQDAAIACEVAHPNLPLNREVIAEDSVCGLVTDAVPGQSLLTLWDRLNSENVSLAVRLHIICEVLGALEHAQTRTHNAQPLCHGDVGPHNIWLGQKGQVFLRGLGFSRSLSLLGKRLNRTLNDLGYASPELLRGAATDTRSDIYSAGVMLWEALAGRRRIFHDKPADILRQRLAEQEPTIESLCPQAPGRLIAQCSQALALDPASRYECIADFREDLGGFLDDVYGEDRSPLRQELISLLRKSSSSWPSKVTTKTRKLPSPLPPSKIPQFSSVPTQVGAGPVLVSSDRPDPDTAGHAAFAAAPREKLPPPGIAKLAIPGLLLLIACALVSVRSLRSQETSLQPLLAPSSTATASAPRLDDSSNDSRDDIQPNTPPLVLDELTITSEEDMDTESPAELPSVLSDPMEELLVTATVNPPEQTPPTEPLQPRNPTDANADNDVPTLRLEQLRLVGGSRPLTANVPSPPYADGADKTPAASRWRRKRSRKLRPIDERDPYAR